MKLAIMQPYLFPYIGYFQLIQSADKFIVYDDVNYIKQGWINRNRILVSGNASYITVPVKNGSSFVPINAVEISQNNWKEKWLKAIQLSYGRAVCYDQIFPMIENVISQDQTMISQLAVSSIRAVCDYLEIATTIHKTSTSYKNSHLKSEQRVLDICQQEKCLEYINPKGGLDLYSKENFQQQNIQLRFLHSSDISYRQFTNEFVPWLSIIDILMHNPKQQVQKFLEQYELV